MLPTSSQIRPCLETSILMLWCENLSKKKKHLRFYQSDTYIALRWWGQKVRMSNNSPASEAAGFHISPVTQRRRVLWFTSECLHPSLIYMRHFLQIYPPLPLSSPHAQRQGFKGSVLSLSHMQIPVRRSADTAVCIDLARVYICLTAELAPTALACIYIIVLLQKYSLPPTWESVSVSLVLVSHRSRFSSFWKPRGMGGGA